MNEGHLVAAELIKRKRGPLASCTATKDAMGNNTAIAARMTPHHANQRYDKH